MPTIRQATVDGSTFKLKRYSTGRRGKQYEYTVWKDGKRVGGGVYTREKGEEMFRELAMGERQNNQMGKDGSRGPALPDFGRRPAVSGETSIPGLGPVDSDVDGDTDDDDQPSLPFF